MRVSSCNGRLLGGYQKENERLSTQLKSAKEELRVEAAKGDDEARILSLRLAELERTHAERAPEGMREQLERSHAALASARETACEREGEMRHEIDRLRLAKKELEGRVGGVDIQSMAAEHERAKAAEGALADAEERRKKEVARLQTKLTWYMDNQPLIDEIDARREAAEAHAAELQAMLDGPRASGGSVGAEGGGDGSLRRAGAGAMSDAERVAVLERQLASLEKLLEQRVSMHEPAKPNGLGGAGKSPAGSKAAVGGRRGGSSLVELIAAAGPSPEEVQRVAYLETRVEQLEAQLAESDTHTQKRLRSLRQQHDRVSAGYETRLKVLVEKLSKHDADDKKAGGLAASRTRVRELEKQVEEIRTTYGKRTKELEAKLAEATKEISRRAARANGAPNGAPKDSRPPFGGGGGGGGTTPRAALAPSARANRQSPACGVSGEGQTDAHAIDSEAAVTYQPDAENMALSGPPVAMLEEVGELASTLTLALARLEGGLAILDGEVSVKNPLAGPEVVDAHVARLANQLHELEERHASREAEAAELMTQVQRVGRREAERVRSEMGAALDAKNAEVDAYRCELDAIVLDVKLLQSKLEEAHALNGRKPRPRDV